MSTEVNPEVERIAKRAAEGDVDAMVEYASILENGKGVPVDLPMASLYYKNAENDGSNEGREGYLRVRDKIRKVACDKCSEIRNNASSK
ncbi:hypothetical protein M9Y10_036532 [Tritrichomonas musculus]|uniref:Sel1 repeat family protein n=1 Tax=Tritrichomonas musculus TaxID=1915356 RepID=A0ABR2GUC1_9EUKA